MKHTYILRTLCLLCAVFPLTLTPLSDASHYRALTYVTIFGLTTMAMIPWMGLGIYYYIWRPIAWNDRWTYSWASTQINCFENAYHRFVCSVDSPVYHDAQALRAICRSSRARTIGIPWGADIELAPLHASCDILQVEYEKARTIIYELCAHKYTATPLLQKAVFWAQAFHTMIINIESLDEYSEEVWLLRNEKKHNEKKHNEKEILRLQRNKYKRKN